MNDGCTCVIFWTHNGVRRVKRVLCCDVKLNGRYAGVYIAPDTVDFLDADDELNRQLSELPDA